MSLQKLLKHAEALQKQLAKEVEETVVDAGVGAGMVVVSMNGNREVVEVKIDPEVLDPADPDLLEDLLRSAVNQAFYLIQEALDNRRDRRLQDGLPRSER